MGDEFLGGLGGFFAAGLGDWIEGHDAGNLGIGVGDFAAEAGTTKDDDEAVFFYGADEDFDAGDFDGV